MLVLTGPVNVPKCPAFRTVWAILAPQLVLRRHAGDGRARTADPAAFDNGHLLTGTAGVPCEPLASLATAQDHGIEFLDFRHDCSRRFVHQSHFGNDGA